MKEIFMDTEIIKIIVQITGVGGLSLVGFSFLFKEVIRKSIFPTLTREQGYKLLNLIILLIALLSVCSLGAWTYLESKKISTDYKPIGDRDEIKFTNKSMKIIGIYPNDIFGTDQEMGLKKSIGHTNFNFELINLNFLSFSEMKSGNITRIIDTLKILLKNENVAAIIGPSITECSTEILKTIYESGSKSPVFITSAASEESLKWDFYSKHINLFRTGTGIDTRAKLISNFLNNEEIQSKCLFLVERNHNYKTFGELYLRELLNQSSIIKNAIKNNSIQIFYYSNSKDSLSNLISYLDSTIDNFDYIFMLGVGSQFSFVVDKFYKTPKTTKELPKFGGWMNGYSLNSELGKRSASILGDKIFEITDIDLGRSTGANLDNDLKYLKQFENDFGMEVHPGMRDYAITYDAFICITETFESILSSEKNSVPNPNLLFDNNGADFFCKVMKKITFEAISSKIQFDEKGINSSSRLYGAIYNSRKNIWTPIDLQLLLNL